MNLKEKLQKKVQDFALEQARQVQLIAEECRKLIECDEFDENVEKKCTWNYEGECRRAIIYPVYIQNENVVEIFDKSVPFELPQTLVSKLLQQLSCIVSSRMLKLGFEGDSCKVTLVQAIRSYRYLEVELSW